MLWGDYTYTNHIGGLESGDASPLVHITASATDPQTSVAGEYTFYGRFVAWTAADNREPLSTNFMTRFVNLPAAGKTTLTVWRDARVNQGYFACGATPTWYPLSQEAIGFFDEQENPELTLRVPVRAAAAGARPSCRSGPARSAWRLADRCCPRASRAGLLFLNLNTLRRRGRPSPPDDPTRRAGVRVRSSQGRGPLQHGLAGDHAGFREGAEPRRIPGSSDMTAMSLVKSEVGSMRFRFIACPLVLVLGAAGVAHADVSLTDQQTFAKGPRYTAARSSQRHQRAARRRPDPAPD